MARFKKPSPPDTEPGQIRIRDRSYPIPLDLTVGEARAIKQITGGLDLLAFNRRLQRHPSDPDVCAALAYVVLHRADPAVTIEDVDLLLWGDLDQRGAA